MQASINQCLSQARTNWQGCGRKGIRRKNGGGAKIIINDTIIRGIKLLEHAMKVVERICEHIIRQQIEIDDMQFGFMKGKGTTDAIFMARQMQENFRVKGNKLYFGFVDLEKAFDRVPREVISWAMRKLGVEEWLVSAVMSMYTGAK